MADTSFSLKPDHSLIDPNFEGYKLSLDSLPAYKNELPNDVLARKLINSQYSYQHVQSFGLQNHLIQDPWCHKALYYVDTSLNIVRCTIEDLASGCVEIHQVFSLQDVKSNAIEAAVNVSFYFICLSHCLVNDGSGTVYIVETGERDKECKNEWTVEFQSSDLFGQVHSPSTIVHAMQQSGNELQCLLLHVDEMKNESNKDEAAPTSFISVIEWIIFIKCETWAIKSRKSLIGRSAPTFAAIIDENHVCISSDKQFEFCEKDKSPELSDEKGKGSEVDVEKLKEKQYTWTQTLEDVTVYFPVHADVSKLDISIVLTSDSVDLKLSRASQAARVLCVGDLGGLIDVDSSVWILHDVDKTNQTRKLELMLTKQGSRPEMWQEVVKGCEKGEYIPDPAQIAEIHERLAHLTSDTWNSVTSEENA